MDNIYEQKINSLKELQECPILSKNVVNDAWNMELMPEFLIK